MEAKRFSIRSWKIAGIFLVVFIVLLAAFHFWFITHAKDLLESLVYSKSQGRLRMKVEKFQFSYFSKRMVIEKVEFYNTDTTEATTAYRFKVDRINLQVYALLPIIFQSRFLIDSLSLQRPDITITRLRESPKDERESKKDLSIPEEMGKVYHSIQDALEVLNVKRFEIEDARVTLTNNLEPDRKPIVITKLFFHLDNLLIDSSRLTGNERFLFGENIVLRTRNQDILFPDGRHRLSFKRFRINMRKRLVEFDSCTIAATKDDSSNASFKVFFDALLLTDIDFDTLYRHEVIKADSVYCVNPQFELDVDIPKNSDRKRQAPKLDRIIQQLTGDLQLGFVVVQNASINITTTRNDQPTTFTSDHNNFEMQGFTVDKDAPRPVLVKSFAMAIRNYENFIKDSSYSIQFDSILFNNNRILLSNFKLQQLVNGIATNSFSMPQFELRGLVWDDLVFNRHFHARGATLYRPLIDFTVNDTGRSQEKRTVFNSLGRIGRVMELDELDILDGKIDLVLKGNTQLHLQNASLSIQSNTLFDSKRIATLEESVNHLSFSHGLLQTKNLSFEMENAHYLGDSSSLEAGKITVSNKRKTIVGVAKNVSINEIAIDDSSGNVKVQGVRWKEADWKMAITAMKKSNRGVAITLEDIEGRNTTINTTIGERSISTYLSQLSLTRVWKPAGGKWQTGNLALEGNRLKMADSASSLSVGDYRIVNQGASTLNDFHFHKNEGLDSMDIRVPRIEGKPDIPSILNGTIQASDLVVSQPSLRLSLHQSSGAGGQALSIPLVEINKIRIEQPDIRIFHKGEKGSIGLNWQANPDLNKNFLELEGLQSTRDEFASLSANKATLNLNHLIFSSARGKIFNSGGGEISAELQKISVEKRKGGDWEWSTDITSATITNFSADSLGKKSGDLSVDQAAIANLSLNSNHLDNPIEWLRQSPSFQFTNVSGKYRDSQHYFQWHNASYLEPKKLFALDSFAYQPSMDHEAFVASHPYQADDFRAKTGKITIDGIDLPTYLKDTVFNIHSLRIQDAVVTDFRDLRPPFRAGVIKRMPVQMIRKMPILFSIDSILLTNATSTYSVLNAKTNEIGIVPVTRMTIRFFPVRNYNLSETDSLRIQANGYLMDSIWVRLRVRESYYDSLSGFLMTVRMKPASLVVMNPVLIPLSSVKILSGSLDTLSMRAAGREYLSYGEMKMYYRDLKVKFLKDGNETKKSFLASLITFVANSFVIRNKNDNRTSRVFFIRLRDRSILNFLVKTTMSGIASSVGAKGNQKILRKYKKELRARNLPPVDYD